MDTQKYHQMIHKMVHPNVTVSSLAMYAKRIAKQSPDVLCAFLEVSCENDIFKTASVVHLPLGKCSQMAKDFVWNILEHRCRCKDTFTHLELLAVTVYKDHQLLLDSSTYFTEQLLSKAFSLADVSTACWLLHMGLKHLPEEACRQVRKAFCTSITTNNGRMDSVLPELLAFLMEYNAPDVLSVLLSITGAKRIEALCGDALFNKADELIRSGQDSVQLWEVYFDLFFSRPHTPEELLVDGLWHLEMYADEKIINDVGAIFYLYVAIHYGVEHPVFEHIHGFAPPSKHRRTHALRYRELMDSMWDEPEKFAFFLKNTIICNPFYMDRVQKDGYTLFESAHDPFSYGKLIRLFEAHASPSVILTIFFYTDLRQNLPLEDVFYLAQRYEVLPEFLEAVKAMPFWGVITRQNYQNLIMSPLSYFTTKLHIARTDSQSTNYLNDEQKGQEEQYTITGFENGIIRTALYKDTAPTEVQWEKDASWTDAVATLEDVIRTPNITRGRLKHLNITKFSLNSFTEEHDLNLLTQLILNNPDCLPTFLEMLKLCEWNACFQVDSLNLKRDIFENLTQYQPQALQMFETLFSSGQSIDSILDLYFYTIYKAILPLNRLLGMADHALLMEKIPNYVVYCRVPTDSSDLCRPINIRCGYVYISENSELLFQWESFAATIADFSVSDGYVSRITVTPHQTDIAIIKARGALFGYLANNTVINERRANTIATFPSSEHCTYREIAFNMNCVEQALSIRRSDAAALRQLLQVLGKANPFAFQTNSFADRVYLSDLVGNNKKKSRMKDMMTTMLLNVDTVEDIRDLYLHTSIKYHLHLSELSELVRRRRETLAEQLPHMFDGIVFHAIADSRGMLCMPWLTQSTIQVDQKYAGMFLNCHIQLNQDGTILPKILHAVKSDEFFEIWMLCKQAKYHSTLGMRLLVDQAEILNQLQDNMSAADAKLNRTASPALSFHENVRLLHMLFRDPVLHEKTIGTLLSSLIRQYYAVVSQKEMEAVVAGLTEKWLKRMPVQAVFNIFLPDIYDTFLRRYSYSDLDSILHKQCQQYAYSKNADMFDEALKKIHASKGYPQVPFPDVPEQDAASFARKYNQLKELLSSEVKPPVEMLDRISALICAHYRSTPQSEMKSSVIELTGIITQRCPADYMFKLVEICNCFSQCYPYNNLDSILLQQIRNNLDPAIAYNLEKEIQNAISPQMPTLPANTYEMPSFDEAFTEVQESLLASENSIKENGKKLAKLIRYYHDTVPLQEMLPKLSTLTETFMKRYAKDQLLKVYLGGLHHSFHSHYNSPDLGMVMYQQACQHLSSDIAAFLEQRIASANVQNPLDKPPSVPKIEMCIKKMEGIHRSIQTSNADCTDIAKQIKLLIQNYHSVVPLQKMLLYAAGLTEALIQRYTNDAELKTVLLSIHECFCTYYRSVDFSLILCLQVYQYWDKPSAVSFEYRVRASKLFWQHATHEIRIESFVDRERIPLWKELYYTT